MSKKITYIILVVTIMAGGLVPSALSAPLSQRADASSRRGLAQVLAVQQDSFKVQTYAGETWLLLVDEETRFRGPEGELSLDDIQVGEWIIGEVHRDSAGGLHARLVLVLPAGFEPQRFRRASTRGEVWEIDLQSGAFDLHTRQAEILRYYTDEHTHFYNRGDNINSLDDLAVHMQVIVFGRQQPDGTLRAAAVLVTNPRPLRHSGSISAVDLDKGTFTLQRRDGQTLDFDVNENTSFASEGKDRLEDLQPGMHVLVTALSMPDGTSIAIRVVVRQPPES